MIQRCNLPRVSSAVVAGRVAQTDHINAVFDDQRIDIADLEQLGQPVRFAQESDDICNDIVKITLLGVKVERYFYFILPCGCRSGRRGRR